LAALRGSAAPPPLLRGMARVPAQRHRDATTRLARRLANVPEAEWEDLLLELVRDEASLVLGRRPDQLADPATTFKELGFDSLSAVELRNRLDEITGLRLPSTLVFDHPTPAAVVKLLRSRIERAEQGAAAV